METTLHVMTFEQWKAKNKDVEAELENCAECDGAGNHICTCGHDHDCESCNGTGKNIPLVKLYTEQKKKDLAKLAAWKAAGS